MNEGILYTELRDAELTALLKQGDRKAFNQIYLRYAEALYRFAFNILKDEEECTDAVQDIFVWVWENRELIIVERLKGYLFASVKYKLARVIYNSKRRNEILSSNPDFKMEPFTDTSLELKELMTVISQSIELLPSRAREIFHLSRNEYLSNREIAARLDISEKTVENQMTIALKKLKVSLGKKYLWMFFL